MKYSRRKNSNRYDNIAGYVFAAPWIIGLLAFILIPMLSSLYFSFTKFELVSPPKWVGLGNFKKMFLDDPKFLTALFVTFKFVILSVPLRLAFALIIAIILNKKYRFIGAYRTMYYLPSIIGGSVAISIMWRQIFSKEGAINSMLGSVGIKSTYSWIGNPDTAIWTLVILSAWQFGSSMLIFLAGLKNIPETYYEAAIVDGANFWYKFTKITLPMLTPVIFFNLIMQTINGFMAFTQSLIVTQGGPLDSTLFYALYLYRRGFQFYEMGYASAMAWIMLIIVAFFTALVFKSSSYWVYYEAKGET